MEINGGQGMRVRVGGGMNRHSREDLEGVKLLCMVDICPYRLV